MLSAFLLILSLFLPTTPQQQSVCNVLVQSNITLFNLRNQSQWYDLSQYFRGYSLTYELLTTHPSTYQLDQPFKLNNVTDIPHPVKPNEERVSLDILVDGSLAWQTQGTSLVRRNETMMTVQMARLTSNMQLEFAENIDVQLELGDQCFDLSSLDVNITMVDCQWDNGQGSYFDFHLLVNATDSTIKRFLHYHPVQKSFKRKTLTYISNNTHYLLSGVLSTCDGPNSTSLSIYRLSPLWQPTLIFDIDSKSLSLDYDMELKDFVVDPKNYIFICGSMVAFRVKFEEGREMGISRFQYSGDRRLEKIAAIYTKEGKTVVQVATKSFIIEIDWTEEAVDQKYYEVAKNITDIQDLQFNSRMIMLQADDKYYFYRRGDSPRLKYLLSVNNSLRTDCLLDQATASTIILNDTHSLSYVLSNGYLRIKQPKQNQNLTVVAHSLNRNCSLGFSIKLIDDTSVVQVIQEFGNFEYESYLFKTIVLSDYVVGARLGYEASADGTNITMKHVEELDVVFEGGGRDGYEVFDTFPAGTRSYFRFSLRNSLLVDNCSINSLYDSTVICRKFLTITLPSPILTYTFYSPYKALDSSDHTLIMSYVISSLPQTIHFQFITALPPQLPSLSIPCEVRDVDINTFFVVATCTSGVIYVYRVVPGFGDFQLIQRIEEIEGPIEVIFAMGDPNLLFVRGSRAVEIMRVTSGSVSRISSIPLPKELQDGMEYRVVLNDYNLLLLWENATELIEYGIMDIYHPTLLRSISLMGYRVDSPLRAFLPEFNSDFVSIRLIKKNLPIDQAGIALIRMSVSALSSFYAFFPTNYVGHFAGFDYEDSTAVQYGDQCKRIYYTPKLQVFAQNLQDKIKTINLSVQVRSAGGPPDTLKSRISLINFQLPLRSRPDFPKQFSFNVSKQGDVKLDFEENFEDELFEGSVSSLTFQSEEMRDCEQKGHFRFDKEIPTPASKSVIQGLMSMLDGNLLYVLFENGNISIFAMLPPQESQSEQQQHQLQQNQPQQQHAQYAQQPLFTTLPPTIQPSTDLSCLAWSLSNTSIGVHCLTNQSQRLLWYNISQNYTYVTLTNTIPIEPVSWVANPQKMQIESDGGYSWIFILNGDTGAIKVLRLSTVVMVLEEDTMIEAQDFDAPQNCRIVDFQMQEVEEEGLRLMIVTINEVGLGTVVVNISGEKLEFRAKSLIMLRDNAQTLNYQLSDSKYQQIEMIEGFNSEPYTCNLIVTVSHGHHLQIKLQFSESYVYRNYSITGVYRKYGAWSTMNWASSISQKGDSPNLQSLVLSYNNTMSSSPMLTLQRITQPPSNTPSPNPDLPYSQIRGILQLSLSQSSTSIVPPSVLFRYRNSNMMAIALSHNSFALYNVTHDMELQCTVPVEQKTYTMQATLVATAHNQEQEETSRVLVQVEVRDIAERDQVLWYVLVAMAGAMGVGIGVGAMVVRRRRRKVMEMLEEQVGDHQSLLLSKKSNDTFKKQKSPSLSKSGNPSMLSSQ